MIFIEQSEIIIHQYIHNLSHKHYMIKSICHSNILTKLQCQVDHHHFTFTFDKRLYKRLYRSIIIIVYYVITM